MDVSQYLEIFIDESSEHLQNLNDCIMTLEKEPDNKDTINEVFRAAHSLKGMAGTMGFKRMQHVTHDMENVFQEVRSGKIAVDSAMIDLLFKCLDAIDGYLSNVKASSDEGTEDNEIIIKELNDFIAKANGEVPAAAEVKNEAKAAEAPVEASAAAKVVKIDLSEEEKNEVANAKAEGKKVYNVTVYIQKDCLLKAARAFLVFRAVEGLGQIFANRPSAQDIEDEKFELDFSFCVATAESLDKIIAAAKNVSEIEEVVGEEVIVEETVAKEEVKQETAVAPAAQAAPVAQAAPAAQAAAPAAKKQTPAKPATNRTVRVDIEKLDALIDRKSVV